MTEHADDADETDRAGREYWETTWAKTPLSRSIDPSARGVRNYLDRRFHDFFKAQFSAIPAGSRLIEVGCGNSGWLPYFVRQFGFQVSGLDYSPKGCQQSRAILQRDDISGDVVCADLFRPPPELLGIFDVAVSLGVVEHFSDTVTVVAAIARLLRPGGLLVTTVPNLSGLLGPLQRMLNHTIFDAHVPLTAARLAEAHAKTGLRVSANGYLVPIGLGICTVGPDNARRSRLSELSRYGLRAGTALAWLIDERIRPLPLSRALAGYAYCVAVKM